MEEEKKDGYGKRPLWQWILLYLVIGVVVYSVVYYFILAKHQSGSSMSYQTSSAPAAMAKPTTAMQKFTDSKYFQYGYKIFPGTLSETDKQALAGFAMTTKDMPDGSTQVTLTAEKPEYTTQTYAIKKGSALYFIEMNLKDDDNEANEDHNLRDDTAVVVDPQGYITN